MSSNFVRGSYSLPGKPVKFNSAFRLCYSLQLLPCYNEKHQLITIYPINQTMNRHTRSQDDQQGEDPGHSILWVPVIFMASTLGLYFLSHYFVNGDDIDSQLKFPTSLDDIHMMSKHLLSLRENHLPYLVLLFSTAYVFKQTFAIPGSFFLNLLGGALFGPYLGFTLCSVLNAIGATFCFMLSQTFGKQYVIRYFPDKVEFFQQKVHENRDSLFFFLLFLRLFPMSPNWAINIISPIVGIPTHLFFLSVLIGMMPYNFVCTQTGSTLSQISSVNDIFTMWTMLKLIMIATVALVPGLLIKQLRPKED